MSAVAIKSAEQILLNGRFVKFYCSRWRGNLSIKASKTTKNHPDWKNVIRLSSHQENFFRRLEYKAKCLLEESTVTTYWGYFITKDNSDYWNKQYEAFKRDFEFERDSFVASYESICEKAKSIGRELGAIEWDVINDRKCAPTEPFLVSWEEKVAKAIPCKKELYESFNFKSIEFLLANPLNEDESLLFFNQVSNGIYQKIIDVCNFIYSEKRNYGVISADMNLALQRKIRLIINLFCINNVFLIKELENMYKYLQENNFQLVFNSSDLIMNHCLTRFDEDGVFWILEK